MTNENKILDQVKPLIVKLRKEVDISNNRVEFRDVVEKNIDRICEELDTRWLVSICDTYVDFGDSNEKRNAMFIVMIANIEKLWATNLLMYDVKLNPQKLHKLKENKVIPLWDGMYSFNINHGDMTNNLYKRLNNLMDETPFLNKIFMTVLKRIKENDTALANLAKYHQRLFEPYPKRSLMFGLVKKIRMLFKTYKF